MRQAAAWIARCALWDEAERDPESVPPAQNPALWEICVCAGSPTCESCGGLGRLACDPRLDEPEWIASLADVLRVRQRIERYGLEAALQMEGLEELSGGAIEAMDLLSVELSKVERERARERADEGRRRIREARRGHRRPG